MIALVKATPPPRRQSEWQSGFLSIMPDIVRYARQAFLNLAAEARADAVEEALVSAMLAYVRLHQRGKIDLAYPSVLARFSVAQYRAGRRVAEKMNSRDVLSPYARRKNGICVAPLRGYERDGGHWREVLIEDKQAGPAETAAARIDMAEWLASLPQRDRRIAEALSKGSTTQDAAKQFDLTPGRISQKRREFLESWRRFHGELANS